MATTRGCLSSESLDDECRSDYDTLPVLDSLANALHRHQVEALIAEADLIRDWPEGSDRTDQAIVLIREAMVRCATGRITQADESRVFSILSFAMPAD